MASYIRLYFVTMKTFWLLFFAGFAVRCDSKTFIIEAPPDDFKVYWNVPTFQCKSKSRSEPIVFDDLYEKYGILQNVNDSFVGDQIAILYHPGIYPELVNKSGVIEPLRNGGVPQKGDLHKHLNIFRKNLTEKIVDENFSGFGIIDFEKWRPVFRQNFGVNIYKNKSIEIEKKQLEGWEPSLIEELAISRFELHAEEFMKTTLNLAKKLRPLAKWGYYGFPHCFNMNSYLRETCDDNVPRENDNMNWLWKESTALYPSVYTPKGLVSANFPGLIRGRIQEASRVAVNGAPILPYFKYMSGDDKLFNKSDLDISFSTIYNSSASGFIIWGSSNDFLTTDKCKKFKKYLEEVLGPTVARYTKQNKRKLIKKEMIPPVKATEATVDSTDKVTARSDSATGKNVPTVSSTSTASPSKKDSTQILVKSTTGGKITTEANVDVNNNSDATFTRQTEIKQNTSSPNNKKESTTSTTSTTTTTTTESTTQSTTESTINKESECWWGPHCKIQVDWKLILILLLLVVVSVCCSLVCCCQLCVKCCKQHSTV